MQPTAQGLPASRKVILQTNLYQLMSSLERETGNDDQKAARLIGGMIDSGQIRFYGGRRRIRRILERD